MHDCTNIYIWLCDKFDNINWAVKKNKTHKHTKKNTERIEIANCTWDICTGDISWNLQFLWNKQSWQEN